MDAEPSDLDDRELRDAKSWDAYLALVYASRPTDRSSATTSSTARGARSRSSTGRRA